MFERFDASATKVIEAAFAEAAGAGDDAVGTEHVLLALATVDPVTAMLLAEAGGSAADIRRILAARWSQAATKRPDHEAVLATLGVDLAEVRRRAEATFGAEAVTRAAWRVRRPPPRRPVWSRISCSKPLPRRRCESPLAGRPLALIPRVKRLLDRAVHGARPGLASPGHLLLALVTGDEPACEVLTALGVDLSALARATSGEIKKSPSD